MTWFRYMWQDEADFVQDVPRGEGGEQGDALISAWLSLDKRSDLEDVQGQLIEDETLFFYVADGT